MSKLIRLLPSQKKARKVKAPFPLPNNVSKGELPDLIANIAAGNEPARQRMVLGNVYLVLNIVGRFWRHWPAVADHVDDMVSEGLLALVQFVDEIDSDTDHKWVIAKIINRIIYTIEVMLNDNSSLVSASFSTNRKRSAQGDELERIEAQSLTCQNAYIYDYGPAMVDIADAFERLAEADGEEMVDLVILFLEEDHNITNLTEKQILDIRNVVKTVKGEL